MCIHKKKSCIDSVANSFSMGMNVTTVVGYSYVKTYLSLPRYVYMCVFTMMFRRNIMY